MSQCTLYSTVIVMFVQYAHRVLITHGRELKLKCEEKDHSSLSTPGLSLHDQLMLVTLDIIGYDIIRLCGVCVYKAHA